MKNKEVYYLLNKKGYEGKIGFINTNKINKIHRWLIDKKRILVVVDYEYECDSTPYFYKIYTLMDEHGKPSKVPVYDYRWDENEEIEIKELVYYRNYKRSYKDYSSYDKALKEGVIEALKSLPDVDIKKEEKVPEKPLKTQNFCRFGVALKEGTFCHGNLFDDCMYCPEYERILYENKRK